MGFINQQTSLGGTILKLTGFSINEHRDPPWVAGLEDEFPFKTGKLFRAELLVGAISLNPWDWRYQKHRWWIPVSMNWRYFSYAIKILSPCLISISDIPELYFIFLVHTWTPVPICTCQTYISDLPSFGNSSPKLIFNHLWYFHHMFPNIPSGKLT